MKRIVLMAEFESLAKCQELEVTVFSDRLIIQFGIRFYKSTITLSSEVANS